MKKKKCCGANVPCKNCPKHKKKKALCAVVRDNCTIFYFAPLAGISISGQRG